MQIARRHADDDQRWTNDVLRHALLEATSDELREIVRRAHARDLEVLVLAHPDREGSAASHQTWADSYVGKLNGLIDNVFTGDAVADAYELGNEPNDTDHEGASPAGYADLLVQVWQRVKPKARPNPAFIVSGGILSTYLYPGNPSGESWWTDFMAALPAGNAPPGRVRNPPLQPVLLQRGRTAETGRAAAANARVDSPDPGLFQGREGLWPPVAPGHRGGLSPDTGATDDRGRAGGRMASGARCGGCR